MPWLRSLHEPELHGSGFPGGRQLQRDIARGEEALSLGVPDLEDVAGPLELRAFLPPIEIDPFAQRALPSKIEIRRLQQHDLRQADLEIGRMVAINVA